MIGFIVEIMSLLPDFSRKFQLTLIPRMSQSTPSLGNQVGADLLDTEAECPLWQLR